MTSIFDDPFHAIAARVYVDIAYETGHNPPDSEAVWKRAYAYYESLKRAKDSEPKNIKDEV